MTEYSELVKKLRDLHRDPRPASAVWLFDNQVALYDAAAAIEALQAQLPKLGEWEKAKPKGVVTYSDGYAECSHCHEAIWLGWGMNFCPNCGTQNKIIDPDDYDGAKMEVQE